MASYTAAGHCVEGRGDWRRGSTRNVQAARKRRNGAHKQCTSCVPVSSVNAAQHYKTPSLGPSLGPAFGLGGCLGGI